MPGRLTPLVNNEIYHIFNRGVASQPTFLDRRDYQRMLDCIFYYQNNTPPVKFSRLSSLAIEERTNLLERMRSQKDTLVEIIVCCLMPNHFHLLVKQLKDNGISKFVGIFANSDTRFFNTKRERTGPLFEGKFKSVRIGTEEQLLHVSRYIHLNPYTGFVVKTLKDLEEYQYSSLPEYIGKSDSNLYAKNIILSNFRSRNEYKRFVFDQANYQQTLHRVKHLTLE